MKFLVFSGKELLEVALIRHLGSNFLKATLPVNALYECLLDYSSPIAGFVPDWRPVLK